MGCKVPLSNEDPWDVPSSYKTRALSSGSPKLNPYLFGSKLYISKKGRKKDGMAKEGGSPGFTRVCDTGDAQDPSELTCSSSCLPSTLSRAICSSLLAVTRRTWSLQGGRGITGRGLWAGGGCGSSTPARRVGKCINCWCREKKMQVQSSHDGKRASAGEPEMISSLV